MRSNDEYNDIDPWFSSYGITLEKPWVLVPKAEKLTKVVKSHSKASKHKKRLCCFIVLEYTRHGDCKVDKVYKLRQYAQERVTRCEKDRKKMDSTFHIIEKTVLGE